MAKMSLLFLMNESCNLGGGDGEWKGEVRKPRFLQKICNYKSIYLHSISTPLRRLDLSHALQGGFAPSTSKSASNIAGYFVDGLSLTEPKPIGSQAGTLPLYPKKIRKPIEV